MKIIAVCLGQAEKLAGKSYKTGINKAALLAPVLVDAEGLVGDAICNRKHHGGVDQAVYIEGSVSLDWWRDELGVPLKSGTFGENLVIEGLDNRQVAAGDRFVIGDVVLEVTSARIPCATFAAHMVDPKFVKRYKMAARPGIYCRVISGGFLQAGQPVEYVAYTGTRVTLPEMMATFGKKLEGKERERYLSAPIHHKLRAALGG
ncbi:MAG: MOSC domain-containing protein [Allorhizobium sp.]